MIYDADEISEELLRELAQLAESDRSILSVYLTLEQGWEKAGRFVNQESKRLIPLLEPQEKEYFETSVSLLYEYIKDKKQSGYKGPGIAFFVDLGTGYMRGVELTMPPQRLKQIKHFAKDVVEKATAIFSETGVRRILIAGRDRMVTALENELRRNWKDKLVTTIRWDLNATDKDFLKKVRPIMEEVERAEEKELLQKLIAEVRRGGLGVAGVAETHDALKRGQVDTLIVSKSLPFSESEELTSLAKSTGADVEFVPGENKVLVGLGGVGALLRYKQNIGKTI